MSSADRPTSPVDLRHAELVRIVVVRGGVTYDIELTHTDRVEVGIEHDIGPDEPVPFGGWVERHPTGDGTVRLTAHGRIKVERREG